MPYFTREFFDFRYAIHLPKYGILGMMTPSHSVYNHLSRCPFTLSQFRDIFHQSKKEPTAISAMSPNRYWSVLGFISFNTHQIMFVDKIRHYGNICKVFL